jgi:hypothetical protein
MPVFTVPVTNMAVFPLFSAAAEPNNAPRAQSQVPTRPGEFTLSCGWCYPHSAVAPATPVGNTIVRGLLSQSPLQGAMASEEPCFKRRRIDDKSVAEGDASSPPEFPSQIGGSLKRSWREAFPEEAVDFLVSKHARLEHDGDDASADEDDAGSSSFDEFASLDFAGKFKIFFHMPILYFLLTGASHESAPSVLNFPGSPLDFLHNFLLCREQLSPIHTPPRGIAYGKFENLYDYQFKL